MAYGDFATVGLSNCPKSCNHHGLCYRLAKKADAPASCLCMRGYKVRGLQGRPVLCPNRSLGSARAALDKSIVANALQGASCEEEDSSCVLGCSGALPRQLACSCMA